MNPFSIQRPGPNSSSAGPSKSRSNSLPTQLSKPISSFQDVPYKWRAGISGQCNLCHRFILTGASGGDTGSWRSEPEDEHHQLHPKFSDAFVVSCDTCFRLHELKPVATK